VVERTVLSKYFWTFNFNQSLNFFTTMKNNLLRSVLLLCFVTTWSCAVFAQKLRPVQNTDKAQAYQQVRENTNAERLKVLAKQFDEEHRLEMQQALEIARRDSLPVWYMDKNGKIFVLSGLDDSGQLEYTETNNLNAARTTSTDDVWAGGSAGLSLSGSGMGIGLWEAGGIPLISHQELVDRVFVASGQTNTVSDHATHVSGTLIGEGVVANARGMANEAFIVAFDSGNDNSEMANEAANGLLLSNHSYGTITGWYFDTDDDEWYWYGNTSVSTTEDYRFGLYDSKARQWDIIAYNAPYFLTVKSAGNDRDDEFTGSHYVMQNGQWVLSTANRDRDGGADGYDCVSTYGTAKNILTVGAIFDIPGGYQSPGDVDISNFSGWGPTDDGRIKPDLVGNGVGLNSSTSGSPTDYSSFSGTSMSTPNLAGSLLLLQEHCFNEFGVFMRSATLKALAIHTADEAGTNPGPDYRHGWGLLNTRKAAELITTAADGGDAGIYEDVLTNGNTLSFDVNSDGTQPIRVTIAWTDPAATATGVLLNSTVRKLVNDLDLRITKDGTTYFPYTLNPASPNAAALNTQDNNLDNVEQVYIANPTAGTYTVTISHKGTLSGSPQPFSIIVNADSGNTGGGACSGNTNLTSCTGTVADGSGSDNYANDLNCSWTISPPGATSVTLNFTAFDTEDGYDFVRVYDGGDASGDLLGQFSGSSLPPTLTAASGEMYIEFETDVSFTFTGWSANYTCNTGGGGGCNGNTNLTACTGTIADGSGAGNYVNNLNCSWTISPPGATSVTLTFTEFDTEGGYDYVRVYDGANNLGILLGEFSGFSAPPTLTAASGSMYIEFETDLSFTYQGWSANYFCNTGGGTNGCDQATDITCGSTVTGSTSGAPQNVPECFYTLNTAPGKWYRFIGQGTPVRITTCSPNTNYDTKLGVFYGSCANLNCLAGNDDDSGCTQNDLLSTVEFTAQSGETYYIYVTGYDTESGNFELSIECLAPSCQGNTLLTTCNGTVSDGSGNSEYTDDLSCSWTISPVGATSVTLNFTSFDTESCCDNVTVFDGTSDLGDFLGTFAGTSLPPTLTANSGSMFILFSTDASVGGAGWSANYSCTTTSAPAANFSGNPTSGVAPLLVNFQDLSSNAPTSWNWNFGNGQTSTQQNPSYTYTQAGTYSVSLTVTNSAGSSMVTKTNYITVTNTAQAPVANFSASATCGQAPLTVNFSDLSTNAPTSWSWNFGNGQTSTQQNPSFTYTLPGTYTVTLSSANIAGTDMEEKIGYITVVAPVSVTALSGTETCLGTPLPLQANGATQYTWSGIGLNSTTGAQVSAQPAVPGTYAYTVTGSTNNCAANPVSISLTFHPIPAITVSASTNSACEGQSVALSASGAATYSWSGTGLSSNTGSAVTAVPPAPGNYIYTATGTSDGCVSAPQSVSVQVSANNQLSVTIAVNDCPGPNLTFTSNVANGGASSNILWYLNGVAVWSGASYTLLNAVNGDAVYCEATPVNLPPCTQPAVAQSSTHVVDCVTSGVGNIEGLESAVLMPNPNGGNFWLQLELARPLQGNLHIFNALGQLLLTEEANLSQGANNLPLRLAAPVPGHYWLVLQSEGRLHRIGFEVQ